MLASLIGAILGSALEGQDDAGLGALLGGLLGQSTGSFGSS